MSRLPYRGGRGDDGLAYGELPSDFGYAGRGGGPGGPGGPSGPAGNRWDSDRFATERGGRGRFDSDREVYEERDARVVTRGGGFGRPRERSVDEIYERRGPGYGDDRYERRHYHDDDAPRFERAPPPPFGDPWDRKNSTSVTIEKERDVYSPPQPRRGGNRPAFMRRQSSLDTFDRKPLTRFVEREEYGPPARYQRDVQRDVRPPPMVPIPLPTTRQLGPPPRRYVERDYEDIRVAEPELYGDDEYRAYPERVREREVIRRRRRSRSRDSIGSRRSRRSHREESVRSDSISSSSSSDRGTVRSEFPKRGKTRMPARLVSKKAIIDLGYPFEEDGETIIIMRALGRENIDEVIKLSETYNNNDRIVETEQTTYLVGPGAEISAGGGGTTIVEERKTQEIFTVPPPPLAPVAPIPAPVQEVITDTKVVEHYDHHHAAGPIIVNAGHPHHHHDHVEIRETQIVDRSDHVPVGPVVLAGRSRSRDEHAIRSEIRALEAENELLRRERRHRHSHSHSHSGRTSNTELVMFDKEHYHANGEDVTIVRKEAIVEPDGGVRIERDRKAKPPPRAIRAMLKTLT